MNVQSRTRDVGMGRGWSTYKFMDSDMCVNIPPKRGEIPLPSEWEGPQSKRIVVLL